MPTHDLRLDFESFRLDNGLSVFLQHDDSLPIVAVDLWYQVGSKDESSERTGLAHLFEHLMFEGSANYNADYFLPLQEAGGSVNGSTSNDRTNYYELVPSNYLELALWLEADRMANLLPVLSQEKLDSQRSIVKNERRQRYENQPYGRVSEVTASLLYPADHPYSWPVIGSMEHLDASRLEDVQAFFRRYYHPANAALAIVGQFDYDRARRWLDRYFGSIPAGPANETDAGGKVPVLTSEHRHRLEDRVALPRMDICWPVGPRFSADEPALDVVAEILGGRSKESRLKRRLIHETKLVNTVGAYNRTMKLAGQFTIYAYALPNVDLATVERIALEEADRLKREPPADHELLRARNVFLNQIYSRLETVLGRADTIHHHAFYEGEVTSKSLIDEIERYRRLTAADVQGAAQRYLGAGRVVVEVVADKSPAVSHRVESEPETPKGVRSGVPASGLPKPGPTPGFRLPPVTRATLANGLRIAVVSVPKLPRVDFVLVLDAGASYDFPGRFGLARLTADMLDEATTSLSGLEIAHQLDVLGATLAVSSGIESASVSLRALSENAAEAFHCLADIVLRPLFAANDLERESGRLLGELAYRQTEPSSIADEAIDAAIFGPLHPYGRPGDGTESDVRSITPADLVKFHSSHYSPVQATLLAVGDIRLAEVVDLAEASLGHWPAANLTRPTGTQITDPGSPRVTVIDRPGSAQSVLRIGRQSVPRTSPDYFPLLLLNTILGGQFASRLNLNLREDKGYTYGASSSFSLRRHGGSFVAGAEVGSTVTTAALREMLTELQGIAGMNPVTTKELDFAKSYLIRRFPSRFETTSSIASQLAQLAIYGLPDDYYDAFIPSVSAVTLEQVHRAASQHLSDSGMKIVIVGDARYASEI